MNKVPTTFLPIFQEIMENIGDSYAYFRRFCRFQRSSLNVEVFLGK